MTTACNRKQSWQTKLHQDSWGAFRSCFDILLLISSLLCYLPHKEKHEIMEQPGTSLRLGQPLLYHYTIVEIATQKKVVAQAKEDTPKDTVDF